MTAKEPLRLRYYPDPVLRQRAREISRIDDETRKRAQEMLSIMYSHGGIGLAGPQVGWLERLLVINLSGRGDKDVQEVARLLDGA